MDLSKTRWRKAGPKLIIDREDFRSLAEALKNLRVN